MQNRLKSLLGQAEEPAASTVSVFKMTEVRFDLTILGKSRKTGFQTENPVLFELGVVKVHEDLDDLIAIVATKKVSDQLPPAVTDLIGAEILSPIILRACVDLLIELINRHVTGGCGRGNCSGCATAHGPDNTPGGIQVALDTMSPVVTNFTGVFGKFTVRLTTNPEKTVTTLEAIPTKGAESAVELSLAKEACAKARENTKSNLNE